MRSMYPSHVTSATEMVVKCGRPALQCSEIGVTFRRMKISRRTLQKKASGRGYLDGQMLIATPTMSDERFARSLIYVCAHSPEGAMGIIVNQPASNIKFPDLLVQLEVLPKKDLIEIGTPRDDVRVLKGGPVETGRGFVLHTADFFIENSTL